MTTTIVDTARQDAKILGLICTGHFCSHFYLMCLLALLMIFVPAHRSFSLDAWRKPAIFSDHVPAWVELDL